MTVHEFVARFIDWNEGATVLYFDADHNERSYDDVCLDMVDYVKCGVDCCGNPFIYITIK